MDDVIYVCTRFLVLFFEFVSIALFLRAILSWFMQEGENVVMTFLALVTEPLILPIRRLCARFGWFQGGLLGCVSKVISRRNYASQSSVAAK